MRSMPALPKRRLGWRPVVASNPTPAERAAVDENADLLAWFGHSDPNDQITEAAMAVVENPDSWDDVHRAVSAIAPLIAAAALDGAADALRRGTRLARPREPYQSIVAWLRQNAETQRARAELERGNTDAR